MGESVIPGKGNHTKRWHNANNAVAKAESDLADVEKYGGDKEKAIQAVRDRKSDLEGIEW